MTILKISRQKKIEKCASNDPCRHVINAVEIKDGFATATDGKILAHVSVVPEKDGSHKKINMLIHREVISESRKQKKKHKPDPEIYIEESGGVQVPTEKEYKLGFSKFDGVFPNWENIVPPASKTVLVEFGIDASLLSRVAASLGNTCLRITIFKEELQDGLQKITKPILVEVATPAFESDKKDFGIVMPLVLHY